MCVVCMHEKQKEICQNLYNGTPVIIIFIFVFISIFQVSYNEIL